MTSLRLILWIASAAALQLVIVFGIGLWHHWQRYVSLRLRAGEGVPPTARMESEGDDDDEPVAGMWQGYLPFKVVRRQIEDDNQSVCSFYLERADGNTSPLPGFRPGKFLTFRLELPRPDGTNEPVIRCYSLSDAPYPGQFRVSIKRVPAPEGTPFPPGRSSNHFHEHVQAGSVLSVKAPAGHFYLDRSDAPVVLIGGGIGITPMMSMLNTCLAGQPGREIWLFYGVRNSREVVMRAHLEALAAAHPNFQLRLCYSNPLPGELPGRDFEHHGRVDVLLLRTQLPIRPYHFYICGPTPMMQTLVPALEDWGVPDSRIHFEAFGPASIKRRNAVQPQAAETVGGEGSASIMVSFARSGMQLAWQAHAHSLLDFAESNGIAIASGCRSGACGTCQTEITAGEVAYQQAPDFDPEPGTCLPCVCVPRSNLVLEA